jgi:rhodanese-related sulfurtransferase
MTDTDLENRKNLLKASILRDLPPEQIDALARSFQYRHVRPHEIIFKEGDPADAFYLIDSGRVRIFVRHENKMERQITLLGRGEHFGEVALLAADTRTANAESLDETNLLVLSKERFDLLMRDYPDISRKFVREMRDWLIKDQEIIEEEADVVMRASRISWFDFVLLIGVSVLLAITFNMSNPYGIPIFPERPDPVPSIGAVAAMEGYRQGNTLIVDARPENFYQLRHIKGAVNMPLPLFDIVYLMSFSDDDKDKKIVVYGNTVSRPYDLEIADKLLLRGYTDVKVLEGGLSAWEAMGYPVEQKVSK